MSQAFSLYSELTVRQNLELHAKLFDLPASEQGPRVEEMLARFGLKDVADSAPESLPLGVRQRLQLAVAVQHRPEVLILDEPTSGVDPVALRPTGRCEPTDSSQACLSASRARRYWSSFLICSNSEIGTGTTSPDSVAADCARAVGIHNA